MRAYGRVYRICEGDEEGNPVEVLEDNLNYKISKRLNSEELCEGLSYPTIPLVQQNIRGLEGTISVDDLAYIADQYSGGRREININNALDRIAGLINGEKKSLRGKIDKKDL